MTKTKTSLRNWISMLFILCAGISSLTAKEAVAGKTILILVTGAAKMENGKPTGLWLEEFAVPYLAFTDAGYQVEVITPKGGAAPIDPRSKPTAEQAAAWKVAAQRLAKTKALATVTTENFSAIFISGGHGVMFDLAGDPAATKLIQEFDEQAKPIAAVCHGPAALVNVVKKDGTPLVKGRKVAAFTDSEERAVKLVKDMPFLLETRLRKLGAKLETRDNFAVHAVRDGNLITGQNPASSAATAKLLIQALSEDKK
ncbi:MAG: type 1 glutamine amidotransferase domain-containing protein [Rubritalea sp.]|jgi:putative intracellular protease/amidase|tara:strand:- start:3412 stop:4179 length:768 start_codon:yes stop_codon:yes gene_type:complete